MALSRFRLLFANGFDRFSSPNLTATSYDLTRSRLPRAIRPDHRVLKTALEQTVRAGMAVLPVWRKDPRLSWEAKAGGEGLPPVRFGSRIFLHTFLLSIEVESFVRCWFFYSG